MVKSKQIDTLLFILFPFLKNVYIDNWNNKNSDYKSACTLKGTKTHDTFIVVAAMVVLVVVMTMIC